MILVQRLGRTMVSAAAALTLPLLPAGLGAAPAAALDAPAPVKLDTSRGFTDTFQQDTALDTDPMYGLNIGLAARQSPPAGQPPISYTRVSGRWDTVAAPAPYYVQTSHPLHPNQLLFSLGTSAVMLGAPAVADASGHYTVSTVVDPVLGDTGSAGWASVVLSRSHRSTGYVTNGDVDLGVTVRSDGGLRLFHGGGGETPFWTGSVAPADRYAVSLTVSTGADRAVTLTVNGTPVTVTAPTDVTRWPSSAFLYLGAYLSSGQVTTFGDGAGHGLTVSNVDTTATASAKPFVDTFDGSPNATSDSGLNDDLSARQPSLVSGDYTAVSGTKGLTVTPAAGSVQVNSPAHPNVLSFPRGTAAVRLNKPATSDLSGTYTVHAVLTPAVGSTTGTDWASLAVSNSSGTTGAVDGPDIAIGLRLQADGGLTLYQGGTATALTPVAPAPASYNVSLTLASGPARRASVTVNGSTVFSGATTADLPRDGYVALGSHRSAAGQVTTVEDLRVSMLGGLDYYGYFDIRDPDWPNNSVNHSAEVAPWTNLNGYLRGSDPKLDFLDDCRPASCIIDVNHEVVVPNDHGTYDPNPNAASALAGLVSAIGSNMDKIAGIYLTDEAYSRGLDAVQVQAQTDLVKALFPGKMIIFSYDKWFPAAADEQPVPRGVDIVGFDDYCVGRGTIQSELARLEARLTSPDQHLMLYPESTNQDGVANNCPGVPDATVAAYNTEYRAVAAQNPRVLYLQNFRWLGPGQPAVVPLTVGAQQTIGKAVVNATPARPASSVGGYRPTDRTFGEAGHNGGAIGSTAFGTTGDVPLTGHWNGPGADTIGVYHPGTRTFELTGDNVTPAVTVQYGNAGDIPVTGDWSGQGRSTIGVYRPGNQTFYLSNDNATTTYVVMLGNPGWTPLVGDWDGNGTTTVGVYAPDTQTFYLAGSNAPGSAVESIRFGNPGDVPVKGDWDGTGTDSIGVYRPGTREFFGAARGSDLVIYRTTFGSQGDVPLVGTWG